MKTTPLFSLVVTLLCSVSLAAQEAVPGVVTFSTSLAPTTPSAQKPDNKLVSAKAEAVTATHSSDVVATEPHSITVGDYLAFLQSVALHDDPYQLYSEEVGSQIAGELLFSNSGRSISVLYSLQQGVVATDPMVGLTELEAVRYCNWLENGTPSAVDPNILTSTEHGSYEVHANNGFFEENPQAQYHLASFQQADGSFLITPKSPSSSEREASPMMMFHGDEEHPQQKDPTQEQRNADRRSMPAQLADQRREPAPTLVEPSERDASKAFAETKETSHNPSMAAPQSHALPPTAPSFKTTPPTTPSASTLKGVLKESPETVATERTSSLESALSREGSHEDSLTSHETLRSSSGEVAQESDLHSEMRALEEKVTAAKEILDQAEEQLRKSNYWQPTERERAIKNRDIAWEKYYLENKKLYEAKQKITRECFSNEPYVPSLAEKKVLELMEEQLRAIVTKRDLAQKEVTGLQTQFNELQQQVNLAEQDVANFKKANPFTGSGLRFGWTNHSQRLLKEKERLDTAYNAACGARNQFGTTTKNQFVSAKKVLSEAIEEAEELTKLFNKEQKAILIAPEERLAIEEELYFKTIEERQSSYFKAREEYYRLEVIASNAASAISDAYERKNLYTLEDYNRNASLEVRTAEKKADKAIKEKVQAFIKLQRARMELLAPEEKNSELKEIQSLSAKQRDTRILKLAGYAIIGEQDIASFGWTEDHREISLKLAGFSRDRSNEGAALLANSRATSSYNPIEGVNRQNAMNGIYQNRVTTSLRHNQAQVQGLMK